MFGRFLKPLLYGLWQCYVSTWNVQESVCLKATNPCASEQSKTVKWGIVKDNALLLRITIKQRLGWNQIVLFRVIPRHVWLSILCIHFALIGYLARNENLEWFCGEGPVYYSTPLEEFMAWGLFSHRLALGERLWSHSNTRRHKR